MTAHQRLIAETDSFLNEQPSGSELTSPQKTLEIQSNVRDLVKQAESSTNTEYATIISKLELRLTEIEKQLQSSHEREDKMSLAIQSLQEQSSSLLRQLHDLEVIEVHRSAVQRCIESPHLEKYKRQFYEYNKGLNLDALIKHALPEEKTLFPNMNLGKMSHIEKQSLGWSIIARRLINSKRNVFNHNHREWSEKTLLTLVEELAGVFIGINEKGQAIFRPNSITNFYSYIHERNYSEHWKGAHETATETGNALCSTSMAPGHYEIRYPYKIHTDEKGKPKGFHDELEMVLFNNDFIERFTNTGPYKFWLENKQQIIVDTSRWIFFISDAPDDYCPHDFHIIRI